jgi:hypothetical protein
MSFCGARIAFAMYEHPVIDAAITPARKILKNRVEVII